MKQLSITLLVAFSLAVCLVACEPSSQTTVDTTPPGAPVNLTITTPPNDNTPSFVWDAAQDDNSGIAGYEVRIVPGTFMKIGNMTDYSVTAPLADGSHTLEVRAVDNAGNKGRSSKLTFTIDTTPPVISEIDVSGITESRAIITWATNEPSTSQIEYGEGANYDSSSPGAEEPTTGHSVTLSGLHADTTYHFRVKSTDEAGNEATTGDYTFTTANAAPSEAMAELSVHFIDVGQGDSILIDCGKMEVLIDGGEKSSGVSSYIANYVDGPLEVLVATHPHADHIGGLTEVLADFEVEEIWYNGDSSTSKTYSQFMAAVESEGAEVYTARRGDIIEVDGITFDVLHPQNLSGSTNDNSIVLYLEYGEVDFLFTGDAEQAAESSMLTAGIIPDVEILKVGHHGSRTASSLSFLEKARPEVAIYMAGADNKYGHPHAETISALVSIGAKIYGTDVNGTVLVTTNGIGYEVQTER